jgi:eukaryotic-like serine/threonine-protein kinase
MGSCRWTRERDERAIRAATKAAAKLGDREFLEHWMGVAQGTEAEGEALNARIVCLSDGAGALIFAGRDALADALLSAAERAAAEAPAVDPFALAILHDAFGTRVQCAGDVEAWLARQRACLALFEEAALNNLGWTLMYLGRLEESKRVEEAAVVSCQKLGERRRECSSRAYLAWILLLRGELDAADREARVAMDMAPPGTPAFTDTLPILAAVEFALGRTAEALSTAREAVRMLNEVGTEACDALIRLIHAEVLSASGEKAAADEAIASARERLLSRAARIQDPALRESFLYKVPDNARTLELASRFLGESLPG